MATTELLQEYMGDVENVSDLDVILADPELSPRIHWRNVIVDLSYWKELEPHWSREADLQRFLTTLNEKKGKSYFQFGIECMLAFVQANFTGPPMAADFVTFLGYYQRNATYFKDALSMNTVKIYFGTRHPNLLFLADRIFKLCKFRNRLIQLWWQLRAIMIHQHILDEFSQDLFTEALEICNELTDVNIDDNRWKGLLKIEQGQLFNLFQRPDLARPYLVEASRLLCVIYKFNLEKSMKTQVDSGNMPVFSVKYFAPRDGEVPPVNPIPGMPLNRPFYEEVSAAERVYLPDFEQKYLLACLQSILLSTSDDLHLEQIKPFVELLIKQPNTWSLHFQLLILRTQIESKYPRTINRAKKQILILLAAANDDKFPQALNRVGGVFACNLAPLWRTSDLGAQIQFNFGAEKECFQIYRNLGLWDELVKYSMSPENLDAIKTELQISPTVTLWCLVGDAANDVECYKKAWILSKKTSSRAQRSWGDHFYNQGNFKESIRHYQISLAKNGLQPNVLYRYANALIKLERWDEAVEIYNRYLEIVPNDRESWNTLGYLLVNLGELVCASKALMKAVEGGCENFTILNNFVLVHIAVERYNDAFDVYTRLVKLEPMYLDVDVLAAFVYAVCQQDSTAPPPLNDLTAFMGRMVSVYQNNGYLWNLFSSLTTEPALQIARLQKAFAIFTEDASWTQNHEICREVLHVCYKLGEAVLSNDIDARNQVIPKVQLDVTKALNKSIAENHEDLADLHKKVTVLKEKIAKKIALPTKID